MDPYLFYTPCNGKVSSEFNFNVKGKYKLISAEGGVEAFVEERGNKKRGGI